jgi:hypothetical protein
MLFVFASTLLFLLALSGTGLFLGAMLNFSALPNPWLWLWLGFFVSSTLAMGGSLVLPLNTGSLVIFFALGGWGMFLRYKKFKGNFFKPTPNSTAKRVFLFVGLYFLFYLSCRLAYSEWPGQWSDTGGYHAQIIRWANEYGTLPGLGNLYGRLGFNSSWHSLAAVFDNGLWDARSAWIMTALELCGIFFYLLYELCFNNDRRFKLYALFLFPWIAVMALIARPLLYYDNPCLILNSIVILESYRLTRVPKEKLLQYASVVVMLSAASFVIKQMAGVSGIFSSCLVFYLLYKNRMLSPKSVLKIWLLPFAALCIWMGRNAILTGYPFYPLPVTALPFNWTMSIDHVKDYYYAILAWARMPSSEYLLFLKQGGKGFFWFRPWLWSNFSNIRFWVWVFIPFMTALPFWLRSLKEKCVEGFYFLLWSLSCFVYWFFTAPDMRFGSGFFWTFLALGVLFAPSRWFGTMIQSFLRKKRMLRGALSSLGVTVLLSGCAMVFFSPARNFCFIGKIPSYPVKKYVMETPNSSLTIWVPEDGTWNLGNAPLPCAPETLISDRLVLRQTGRLEKGFKWDLKDYKENATQEP